MIELAGGWLKIFRGEASKAEVSQAGYAKISSVIETRHKAVLSQAQFAELLGVSKRTLQD